jgi:hypothetical protein
MRGQCLFLNLYLQFNIRSTQSLLSVQIVCKFWGKTCCAPTHTHTHTHKWKKATTKKNTNYKKFYLYSLDFQTWNLDVPTYVHMSSNKQFIHNSSGQVIQHQGSELSSNNNTNNSSSSNNNKNMRLNYIHRLCRTKEIQGGSLDQLKNT